jgi:hypothetical protein
MRNIQNERGSEILQVILVGGILLVLIITLFYPQMESMFNNMMGTISTWFEDVGSRPFQV